MRDCVGFEDCKTCLQSVVVTLCNVNDRIQFRCSKCSKRSTSALNDPRVKERLCVQCWQRKEDEEK